jgi:4-hydroxy-3-methylbut-2-en-1-yl diphosphate synthase IspG/GcpE
MNISKDMQKVLTDEIKVALYHMKKVDTAEEKLFFLSAVYGVAFRIMNIQFDPELAFIHHVVNAAYSMMNTRLASIRQNPGLNTFPKNVFEMLEDALGRLIDKIEKEEKTYPVLENIFNLAYSTTGNGYYLYLKGMMMA